MIEPNIIPAITTDDGSVFSNRLKSYLKLSNSVHVDFSDGSIANNKLLDLKSISWPEGSKIWLHLMVYDPSLYLDDIIKLKPFRVIFPFDVGFDNPLFSTKLRRAGIESGIYLNAYNQLDDAKWQFAHFQEVMVFAGSLGHQGARADLSLLKMGPAIKSLCPFLELGWDGGVNDKNIVDIKKAGFTNIVSGGFIGSSPDYKKAYSKLKAYAIITNS
jgi:ribulose-phosphate 3-epimerase